jgi:hypothetical protein
MKQRALTLLACLLFTGSIWSKDLLNTTWTGSAVKGYDPVAYFTDNKADALATADRMQADLADLAGMPA